MTDVSGEQFPAFPVAAPSAAKSDLPVRQPGDFRIGHVLTWTFSILWRHLLPFSLLYGVASLLLNIPVTFTNHDSPVADVALATGIAMVLSTVFSVFAGAVAAHIAIDDMRGRRVDMTETLRVALRSFFPALGATVASVAPAILGLVLIFPAAMLISMFFVVLPVCVIEGVGPMASMRRSRQLTKGYRWRIFGLWFAIFIIESIVQIVIDQVAEPFGSLALTLVPQIAWGVVIGAVAGIVTAVTYRDLRVAKEGVETDHLAKVFD